MGTWQRLVSLPAGRRGRWAVLAAWLGLLIGFGWLAGLIGQVQDNDETNWMPASAQSTRAVHLARLEFPAGDTAALIIVYSRDSGIRDGDRAAVQRDHGELVPLADGGVVGPEQSSDGRALLLTVPVATGKLENGQVDQVVARARQIVRAGLPSGLTAKTTGPAASRVDSAEANGEVDGVLTLVTVGVVALVLLVTYRSPVLLVVPLACVVVGVVVAQGGAYLIGKAGTVISGSSFLLMIVLVFGVGTDYALLLISRYRDELRRLIDQHEAMAMALRRTVPSVLAAAATMTLAALVLLAADMNATKGLGPLAAVAVVAALIAMTTLLPALLVVVGPRVFWPRIPRSHDAPPRAGGWPRIAALVSRRPRRTWIRTAIVLAAMTAGTALLQVGALAGGDNFTRAPESVTGQETVHAHFAAGTTAPALIYAPAAAASAVAEIARSTPGVETVRPVETSTSGQWVRISAVLAEAPASTAAQATVARLRGRLAEVSGGTLVGGQAAALLDQNAAMNRDLAVIVPLVIAAAMLVLGALLRAVVAPLLLLGCTLLSAGAALGLSSLLFHALGFPRTDQSVLTLGFLFLVALGVDYTIFLMAGAREAVRLRGHRSGMLDALIGTGGVITSAGVVLAATFLILTITPVVLNIQLGLLVALGVLIDAFVVRTILLPTLVLDIGPRTWWPSYR
jgi:putative drug exporter of the RND superfamily